MGTSHNPDGTAKVTDGELVDALNSVLSDTSKSTLAVPARDVAERLPIKKQAVGKRLDRLAQEEDSPVERFKGSQAWLYFTPEHSGQILESPSAPAPEGGRTFDELGQSSSLPGAMVAVVVAALAGQVGLTLMGQLSVEALIVWAAATVILAVPIYPVVKWAKDRTSNHNLTATGLLSTTDRGQGNTIAWLALGAGLLLLGLVGWVLNTNVASLAMP